MKLSTASWQANNGTLKKTINKDEFAIESVKTNWSKII